jgi:hypothetical protein
LFGTAPTATQGGSIRFEEWKRQRVAVTAQWSRAGSSQFHPIRPEYRAPCEPKRGHRLALANRCVADREVEWASTGASFPASVGTPQRECSATWVPHANLCFRYTLAFIRRQTAAVGCSGALVLVDPPYEVENEFGEVRIECTPSSACAHALAAGTHARVPVIMGFAQ